MIVCAAIHGILTRQTRASWPDEFDVWISRRDPRVRIVKKEYVAGPLPIWNWVKNRWLAKGLAAELALFKRGTGNEEQGTRGVELWIVAHSNGAVIAMDTLRLLARRGVRVAGVILSGAACESDIDRSGIARLVESGKLGRAVAFSSATDRVVRNDGWRRWVKWPYGNLGRVGWMREGMMFRSWKIYTLWFAGGHCGYFARGQEQSTFEMFYKQMREGR